MVRKFISISLVLLLLGSISACASNTPAADNKTDAGTDQTQVQQSPDEDAPGDITTQDEMNLNQDQPNDGETPTDETPAQ